MNVEEAAELLGKSTPQIRKWDSGKEECPGDLLSVLKSKDIGIGERRTGRTTFIDLFAGIGGMRRAFEAAGAECVFTSEWNTHALKTYLANHGAGHRVVGDITKVDAADIPDHDILVAGFPCQPFSIAGVSKKNSLGRKHGFEDETQGTLFFDVARIIKEKKPKAFLLENVKNLASHNKGQTFEVIKRTLTEQLGYTFSYKVIDGTPWVPQKRPRIFMVGHRDGEEFDFDTVFVPENGPKMNSVLHEEGEPGSSDCPYAPNGVPLDKYTLTAGLWDFLERYAEKHRKRGNGFGYGMVGPDDVARTMSARYGKDGSEILIRNGGRNPRRLTPREAARLLGFDQKDGPRMRIPVSDAQAYRQFGNSVVVPCVSAIAESLVTALEKNLGEILKEAA
ncbi:DNA (cytosine-5-)-methyltransferase [Roseibium sp. RKSG952]|nr:DNA (cytosine-5-)-methyltransferase [Roseibium sp. RKSG952]